MYTARLFTLHGCRVMIVIYAIIAVIGSFVCALIKARIDEWLEDSSMNMNRLSLKRINQAQGTCDDPVEITDDESFNLSSNTEKITKECTNMISHGAANVSSSASDTSKCNSKHDISNLSSDDDVVIVNTASNDVPNKSQSMFNWNKSIFTTGVLHRNIFLESSGSIKVMPIETPNKRQKLMNDLTSFSDSSTSDDELMYLGSPKRDDSPPQVRIQYEKIIAAVKVKFPVKPYPCQIAVMHSLIQGCTKEQNCLLESPTGSGKTLALLCGALAWQEQFSEKIEGSDGMDAESSCCSNDDSLNDNFFLNSSQYFDEEMIDKVSCKNKAPKRVPKIYYGTRTHKQIEQVVREFKKTAYRNKRMTILSSRKQTCIQKTDKNKNELCNELLDPLKGKTCPYYNEHSRKKADYTFKNMSSPWDIEDLVSLGNGIGSCPYFGARSLMAEAEIIFCPYNYILDPDIRESMQIHLKGDIVILDEAHNIEDMCRKAASVNFRDDEMANAAKECKNLSIKRQRDRVIYDTIQEYLTDIVKFLKNIEVEENGFDRGMISNTWVGIELRVLLDVNNVGCSRFPNFLAASRAAIEDFGKNMKETRPEKIMPTISRDTKKILEYLCFSMQMIASDILVDDYRMYVIEMFETTKNVDDDTWISSKMMKTKVRTMKLICMNPAVVFAPLARTVRSVIVTSGTLTPTTSFQGELGTQFPHIVNPNHIIPKEQVYVRCIPRGPNGVSLKAVYDKVYTYDFQDELGNFILQVCDAVPYGVLCFFSSYNTMKIMHERWKQLGIWEKLSGLKEIFTEPLDNKDLPVVMKNYRKVIEESSSESFRKACGAILFAVYRGKVAEGIDFSDNEARCVLAVGIPYSYKSNDVKMKMKYNDSKVSKGLLPGHEWYTVNAFRAVNQAIGRCVRHIGDWGAVLLVDERYQQPSRLNHLPKWIKTNMKCDSNYNLEMELQDFVAIQAARERGEKCVEN